MILFPAIDLYENKVVRLEKGDYDRMTVYDENPASAAERFIAAGADHLHIVDLEGARSGRCPNFSAICEIKRQSGAFCQVGGGIRNMDVLKRYFSAGVDRAVLGTAAVRSRGFLQSAVASYGERIAVGVDVRDGKVAVNGWTEDSGNDLLPFIKELEREGVTVILCTDISRDGIMQGTNFQLYRELSEKTGMKIIASGGVSSVDEIRMLAEIGIYGAVIGKALYSGAVGLKQALEAAK